MIIRSFGRLADGRPAGLYILRNRNGAEAHITDFGAALVRLYVPDRDGRLRDVVLGYDDVSGYERGTESMGGTVGRYANRIGGAGFTMDGRKYALTANAGPNALHGGRDFYVHRLWDVKIPFDTVSSSALESRAFGLASLGDRHRGDRDDSPECSSCDGKAAGAGDSVTLCLESPDGDQGFPGAVRIEVTYSLTCDNALEIDYRAKLHDTDMTGIKPEKTPLNLTNHSYFNLSGHGSGAEAALGQYVMIDADRVTETDENNLPTGRFTEVEGTPLDFRQAVRLGDEIRADYRPLQLGNGYDHNYCLNTCGANGARGEAVAALYSEQSGICMKVYTDMPGLQLYSANYLTDEPGKDGAVYERRSAVCMETQYWPDTVNHKEFPGGMLRAGEEFRSRTVYAFTAK